MKRILITITLFFVLANAYGQTTASEWFARGNEHFTNGDNANAITAFSEAINQGITNIDAWWFRAISYYRINNYDACINDCNIVINRAPDFPTVYMYRGFAYGGKGMNHKAIADYRTGLEKGFDPSTYILDKSIPFSMWFLGLMHMEIVINRFLGNAAAVTRYENWLRTVINNNNVTRAEIETFYRNGIRELISSTVNEAFNRISFMIDRNYNAVLTRNPQNGHYVLSYEGVGGVTKELSAQTLVALSSAMSRSGDFSATAFNEVRTQAGLMSAIVLSDTALNEAISILVNFYINPSPENYNLVKDWYVVCRFAILNTNNERYTYLQESVEALLSALNEAFKQNVILDTNRQTRPVVIDRIQEGRLIQLR